MDPSMRWWECLRFKLPFSSSEFSEHPTFPLLRAKPFHRLKWSLDAFPPAKQKIPPLLLHVEQVMLKSREILFSDPFTSTWSAKDCWVTKKGHWREIRVQSVESLEVRCQNSSEENSSTLMDKSNKNIFGKIWGLPLDHVNVVICACFVEPDFDNVEPSGKARLGNFCPTMLEQIASKKSLSGMLRQNAFPFGS